MGPQPGAFEGWGGASLGRKDRGQCGWTEGSRQHGLLQEEGLKILLGLFPKELLRDFLFVSRVTGTDLSLKPPTLGSEGMINKSEEQKWGQWQSGLGGGREIQGQDDAFRIRDPGTGRADCLRR